MKLSVIVVVRNNAAGIRETLESLRQQKELFHSKFELIVIDGASVDGTTEVINACSDIIDICVSEHDSGIYNAMNKGLALAGGDSLFFLNSGDVIVGPLIEKICASQAPVFVRVKQKNVFGQDKLIPLRNKRYRLPNCHQGIIFDRRNIKYDESYKIASDYKYFLDHNYNENIGVISENCYVFVEKPGANVAFFKLRDLEMFRIRKQYFGLLIGIIYQAPIALKGIIRKFFKLC